jgi:Flagellar hook-length control protein FliK
LSSELWSKTLVKPLLGQVQNQAHLDDLLGSPKAKGGNFVPAASGHPSIVGANSQEPSFTQMLMASIQKDTQLKNAQSKAPAPKIPDSLPRAERPMPKSTSAQPQVGSAAKPSHLAPPSDDAPAKKLGIPRSLASGSAQGAHAAAMSKRAAAEVPESLNPLKKQIGGKLTSDSILNGNAILAFVAGRLEKLDPESVPSIVAGSLWIKEAVASQDVASFMETPMTIGDLSQLLELDQGLLNKASAAGLDPSKVVTPKDFIAALGLDPSKVVTELKTLQQRLPVEGIKPYIERARAAAAKAAGAVNAQGETEVLSGSEETPVTPLAEELSAEAAKPEEPQSIEPKSLEPKSLEPKSLEPLVSPNLSSSVANSAQVSAPINMAQVNQNAKTASVSPLPVVKPQTLNPTRAVKPALLAPTSPLMNPTNSLNAKSQTFSDPSDSLLAQAINSGTNIISSLSLRNEQALRDSNSQQNGSPILAAQLANSQLPGLEAMEAMISSLATGNSKDLQAAESLTGSDARDHYAEMGQEMNPLSSVNIDFGGDGVNQRSLQEHLLARGLNVQTMNQANGDAGTINPAQANLQTQNAREAMGGGTQSVASQLAMKTAEISAINSQGKFELKPEVKSEPEASANGLNQNSANLLSGNLNSTAQSITSLRENFSGDTGAFREDEKSQDRPESLGDQVSDVATSFSQGLQDNLGARSTDSLAAGKLASTTKSGPTETLSSKIFNHAQMMFKNGGGSMRLDMEAPGIGKINVAINLSNNNLDIRIITPSDQARDMITKEVTGLREGLTQQGISLRGLEVGKAGESSSGNFAGQGHQQRGQSGQFGQFGQNAQDQRATYNDMVDYVQSFKNSYAPRDIRSLSDMTAATNRWNSSSTPSTGTGRLEIRV